MSILQYETRVSPEGYITLPPMPEYRDRKVEVVLRMAKQEIDDEQAEEQRKAAAQRFFDSWNGVLEGAPDMTMKQIRAERLERKYGQ